MTADVYVTQVDAHTPQSWQRFTRYEVFCQPMEPRPSFMVTIWEEPGKCYHASQCERAMQLKRPVRLTYYETRQKFLRCTDVRFLESRDVPEAKACQPAGA